MQHLQVSFTHFWGGAEIYCIRLCNLLLKEGLSVHFLCSEGSPLEMELKKNNIPHTTMKVRSYFDLGSVLKIRKLIKKLNITSILTHSFKDAWLITPSLIGMGHIKYYGIFHIIGNISKKDPIHSLIFSRFDKVITTTTRQMNYVLDKNPIPKKKYLTIPLAIDIDFFKPEKKSEDLRAKFVKENEVLIGCVGRISPEKGQREFVEAMGSLIEEGLPVKGILIGKEHPDAKEYFGNIKNYVKKNKLEQSILFLDHTEDVSTYMASLDIFVMPSHRECFGLVLAEAMASGTAALSTNAGGVPEILDNGKAGILVEPYDSDAMAEGLKVLINDPGKRKIFGKLGQLEIKKNYSQEVILQKWLRLLNL